MSVNYLFHPQGLEVHENLNFFNESHPEISCMHCNQPCDQDRIYGAPTMHQDTKRGAAHPRECKYLVFDTMHIHKLYCSLSCVKAALGYQNQRLFITMCTKVYKMTHREALAIRMALPFWTLIEFGGILTGKQHRQFSQTGKISGIVVQSKKKFTIDCSGFEDARSAYTEMFTRLLLFNRFVHFEFSEKDSFWYTAQPQDTKLSCWNDFHSLAGIKPIPSVLDFDNTLNIAKDCQGFFCGEACVNSYLRRLQGQFRDLRIQRMEAFYSRHFLNGRHFQQNIAKSKRLLVKFGGMLDIEQYRDIDEKKYRKVCEPLVQDFPFKAGVNDDGFYLLSNETAKFDMITLMNAKKKHLTANLKMDGDEYLLGTKDFEPIFHIIQGNQPEDMRLHFVCLVIEQEQDAHSHPETLASYVNKSQRSIQ